MSKRIESPVKRFAGAVELKDPLPYLTVLKFERAFRDFDKDKDDIGEKLLPVIFDAVEKWELQNVPDRPTVETFPGSPRAPVNHLIAWLIREVTASYNGNEDGDPNA